jgi:hypothetical protein
MNAEYRKQIGRAHVTLSDAYQTLSAGCRLLHVSEFEEVERVQREILHLQRRLALLRKAPIRSWERSRK